jgi:ATPase family associated with various cellular activities (AAA)
MSDALFTAVPKTPAGHQRLHFYAAVARVIELVIEALGSREAAIAQFPFLAGYADELGRGGPAVTAGESSGAAWAAALQRWEEGVTDRLPIRALAAAAGLDHAAITLLLCVGLIEEDGRFGLLFEALQGTVGQHRPTVGLLSAWGRGGDSARDARAHLRRLEQLGLVQIVNPDAPRAEWALQVPAVLWDALRGEIHDRPAPWARHRAAASLPPLDALILAAPLHEAAARLPALLGSGEAEALLVRGPSHNGRRALVGAVARAMGRGVIEVDGLGKPEEQRLRLMSALATLAGAAVVVILDLGPGDTAEIPRLEGHTGPVFVVMGRQGGVRGEGVERGITLAAGMPAPAARAALWEKDLGPFAGDDLPRITERFRMTSGNIRRAAGLSRTYAALAGRAQVTMSDAREASRALNRQALDTLATRVSTDGAAQRLSTRAETTRELDDLETRCRHRERLGASTGAALGSSLNAGVRALLQGPSGTGKTLAARLLAASLEMDLYRVDLSTVVNKYIGETEKNLGRIFSIAEELDVILLFDEGDALLATRTNVQSSNDRYANLETNYLLQRIEAFEGILFVTTNVAEHIDDAFARRMDVVVDFRPPESAERWTIWHAHLPEAHAVDSALLREVVSRCALTGGQIRNAVLHATLLSLKAGEALGSAHLVAAVQREYRKSGGVCPLRLAR